MHFEYDWVHPRMDEDSKGLKDYILDFGTLMDL